MNIDKKVLNRHIWYEDEKGNIVEFGNRVPKGEEVKGMTYHAIFPLEITEHIDVIQDNFQYKHLCDFNSTIGKSGEAVIVAMVNSGDYTLSEALMLYSQCCERCMNVLSHKYLNGKEGYEEHSKEWERCGTVCKFCKEE